MKWPILLTQFLIPKPSTLEKNTGIPDCNGIGPSRQFLGMGALTVLYACGPVARIHGWFCLKWPILPTLLTRKPSTSENNARIPECNGIGPSCQFLGMGDLTVLCSLQSCHKDAWVVLFEVAYLTDAITNSKTVNIGELRWNTGIQWYWAITPVLRDGVSYVVVQPAVLSQGCMGGSF